MKIQIYLIFIILIFSCETRNSQKKDFIENVLLIVSNDKTINLLKESDTTWCNNIDGNICKIVRLHEFQLYGDPRNSNPDLIDILNEDEFEFLENQFYDIIDFENFDVPDNISFISQIELENMNYIEKSLFSYTTLSSPALSKNGKYALIYVSEFCGIECGGGDLLVFKKENGIWNQILTIGIWLS